MLRAWVLGLGLVAAGCGYRLAGAAGDPLGPFSVTGGEARTPFALVAAAAEEGARAELSREGALAAGEGRASLEVEVLRVDETSEAIAIVAGATDPRARSIRITVTGRARLHAGAEIARETGDMRVSEIIGVPGGAAAGEIARDQAASRAARRLGARLARRALGYPEPSDP